MNETPRANRPHIALFGRTNTGKSSIINALTNQELALVSEVMGTTTDPVYKTMEILPLGPVVLIDTAGLGDTSELGKLRIQKSMEVLNKTDIVVLIADATQGLTNLESDFIATIKNRNIPFLILFNKADLIDVSSFVCDEPHLLVSAKTRYNIDSALTLLGKMKPVHEDKFRLVGDLVQARDIVILVTPIDKAAPKGRLILPQQQVIRDLLARKALEIGQRDRLSLCYRELLERIQNQAALFYRPDGCWDIALIIDLRHNNIVGRVFIHNFWACTPFA